MIFGQCWQALQKKLQDFAQRIVEGRIDGSTYSGDCACLFGTIANVAECEIGELPFAKADQTRPIERFFMGIKPGDNPENSEISKIVLGWLDQFVINANAVPKREVTATA